MSRHVYRISGAATQSINPVSAVGTAVTSQRAEDPSIAPFAHARDVIYDLRPHGTARA